MNWSIQKGKIFQGPVGRASEDHTRISIPRDMMMIQELKKLCLKMSGTCISLFIMDFGPLWKKIGSSIFFFSEF